MNKFYDGTKLLNSTDINGKKPEIYFCTGNRTAGKTYFFKKFLLNEALEHNKKFMLIGRKMPEVDSICESFFTDISRDYSENSKVSYKKFNRGLFNVLWFNDKKIGYVTYLNGSEQIKRISSLFYDVDYMMLDECISETYDYVEKEITKLISIHISVARGGSAGKSVRYVPMIFIANSSTAINPYFTALGININELQKDIRWYKGDGYVVEFTINKNASTELSESAFARAFSKSNYLQGSIDNSMYLDTQRFISKSVPNGSKYILSIMGESRFIGVYLSNNGNLYFSDQCNVNYKFKCTLEFGYQTREIPHITKTIFYDRIRDFVLKGRTFYCDIEIRKNVLDAVGMSML